MSLSDTRHDACRSWAIFRMCSDNNEDMFGVWGRKCEIISNILGGCSDAARGDNTEFYRFPRRAPKARSGLDRSTGSPSRTKSENFVEEEAVQGGIWFFRYLQMRLSRSELGAKEKMKDYVLNYARSMYWYVKQQLREWPEPVKTAPTDTNGKNARLTLESEVGADLVSGLFASKVGGVDGNTELGLDAGAR